MTLYVCPFLWSLLKVLRSISKTTMINCCLGEIVTEDYVLGEWGGNIGEDGDNSFMVFFLNGILLLKVKHFHTNKLKPYLKNEFLSSLPKKINENMKSRLVWLVSMLDAIRLSLNKVKINLNVYSCLELMNQIVFAYQKK